MSVLGCVGVVSAFCPGKLAVTINQAPIEGMQPNVFEWPVLQRLRNVCDQLGSYRSIVDGLQEYRNMTSFFGHVVGTKPRKHAVITGLGSEFHERGLEHGKLVQTNHYVGHAELLEHNGPARWTDDEGQAWFCDSHLREKTLRQRIKAAPESLAEARKKICARAVTTADSMQQMVFQPGSDYARVWVRR